VKVFLRPYWENDIVFEEFPLPHRMSLDFLNISRKIAVEVQGAQHIKYIKHFHKNKIGYLSQLKRDSYKLDFCSANDIVLVEVYPDDEISEEIFTSKGLVL
jgi:very-short-patch-repair endonuclease